MDFGEPDPRRVRNNMISSATAITLQMNDDFFWSKPLQAMRFSEERAFSVLNEPYTIFDTGSQYILVPGNLYYKIIE